MFWIWSTKQRAIPEPSADEILSNPMNLQILGMCSSTAEGYA